MSATYEPKDLTAWIGGAPSPVPDDAEWIEVRDPFHGALAARYVEADTATVDEAVRSAAAAQVAVAAMPVHERAAKLRVAGEILNSRAEALAEAISRQTGKIVSDTIREARRSPWTLKAAASAIETLKVQTPVADAVPLGEGTTAIVTREPAGVVAAVTPFNAPLNLVVHKVAPALAAGNAIVVKPAPAAPLPAYEVAWALEEAGFPAGAVNVVPGGADTAVALVSHELVNVVTFTGSTHAGEALRQHANFKKVLLELGGNSPNIVHADANLDLAADQCLRGGFGNGGQSCNSVQRIIVHRDVLDDFAALLVAKTAELVVGDPLDEATQVGPVVNEASAQRVVEWIEEAAAGGAEVLAGGTRDGALVHPTVVINPPSGCRLSTDEVFAPVVGLYPYDNVDEAIALANATPFGLQAGVFTRSLDLAMDAGRRLKTGGVMVNRSSNFRLDHLPYGGSGLSGVGREGPAYAIEEMTEPKVLVIAPGE